MRQTLTTLGEVTGGLLIAAGAWQFSRSLGLICGGLLLAFFSYLADRAAPRVPEDSQ